MKKKALKSIAASIACTDYSNYRAYLTAVFEAAKHHDPAYTYSEFSNDLGLGSRNAHSVIHGKRDLADKTARKVIEALGILKAQRRFFLASVEYERAKTVTERDAAYKKMFQVKSGVLPSELARKQLRFFESWYNAVILELLRLPNASDDARWIEKRVRPKLTLTQVKGSLELLLELGYAAYDETRGRLYPTEATFATGNEVRGMAIYSFHQQMMDLAKVAMDDVAPGKREVSAVTLSVRPEHRDQLKAEIAALRKKFVRLSNETTDPSEIIQVNFQMFPLFQNDEDET